MNGLLHAALAYGERSWPVLPCAPLGKKPLTPRGRSDAIRDAEIISAWWTRWPDANVAVGTGAEAGIFVLDSDGEPGERSLDTLQQRNGALPETLQARTGGGGRHLLLQNPEQPVPNSTGLLGRGLDVRGNGGYIVAAPSRLRSGSYEWLKDPLSTRIAPAPDWLLALLLPREHVEPVAEACADPQRYAEAALARELANLATAPIGERNARLNNAAFALGRFVLDGVLPGELVVRCLHEVAVAKGLPSAEAERTIQSGLGAGSVKRRSLSARGHLISRLSLSARGKLLLRVLDDFAGCNGWCWPSQRLLLRRCSFASFSTLAAAFREVAPFLDVRPTSSGRGRACHSYRLRWDAIEQLATHTETRRPHSADSPHTSKMGGSCATAAVANSRSDVWAAGGR